jgi:hypothetical protein
VVNTTRYAQALTGVERLCAVMGGFHLSGLVFEPIIGRTCADLAALDPAIVVPGHYTGWRGQHALARAFGERCATQAASSGRHQERALRRCQLLGVRRTPTSIHNFGLYPGLVRTMSRVYDLAVGSRSGVRR